MSKSLDPTAQSRGYFKNVYGVPELIQGMNFTSLCSSAGQYDNPIPPRFLAPIEFLKIPAQLLFILCTLPPSPCRTSGPCNAFPYLHILTAFIRGYFSWSDIAFRL